MFRTEYYRFQKGESSVVLVGHDHAKDLLLHCDYTSENQRQRLHILLDFTLTKEDIIRQCSRTHRCGQKQEPVYYMISSDLPSDKKLVYDMAKYFADLGACIQVSHDYIIVILSQCALFCMYVFLVHYIICR